jgi:regulator of RNase E activity RraA
VVLGTTEGVIFIPPHLVEEVITASKEVRLKDEFRVQLLLEGKYTSLQIYPKWGDDVEAEFQEWRKKRQG